MDWNWEAVSAVGQLVGAFAVVSTLIYLAVEVRQAKLSAADNNRLSRVQGVREYFLTAASNPDVRIANTKAWGLQGLYEEMGEEYGLTADEAGVLDHCHSYWFYLHWGQFTSTTEERDLQELRHMIKNFYTIPWVRASWERSPAVKPLLDAPFVEFVEEILQEWDRAKAKSQ